ncbi:MAG: hypothetical protein BWK77_08935 [Verrucomicrobia bacterium A1]|nr:MAG: hypothetical protein BWK77_08935 [Verrucomicrobia bacterium A1]
MKGERLNPTLWRTCRVLAGATRVRMLRLLMTSPAPTVTEVAGCLGIGLSRASQELRRLNSRGLLEVHRSGAEVRYRLGADPQVADAAGLTAAIHAGLRSCGAARDEVFVRIASCFTHPRRLEIVRAMLRGPQTPGMLRRATGIPYRALKRHLALLHDRQVLRREDGEYRLSACRHPLFRAIVTCLRSDTAPDPS